MKGRDVAAEMMQSGFFPTNTAYPNYDLCTNLQVKYSNYLQLGLDLKLT